MLVVPRSSASALSICALLGSAAEALAQDPAGLSNQAPATSGKTEVAIGGFQTVATPPPESKDNSSFKISAGGFLSQGNTRTLALTASSDYLLRRDSNQFGVAAAANYGRSAASPGEPSEETVSNYQARVRYDRFFSGGLAGFGSISARRDRFQELDLRLNVDPGLAYYFIDEKGHRLWVELGYDLQYDLRRQDAVDALAADMDPDNDIDRSEVRHNVRVFFGYDNQLTEAVKFNAGLEYLQNVTETENARINADAGLTSQINSAFSVAFTVSVKFDNNPLPGVETTDIISALNLVYSVTE